MLRHYAVLAHQYNVNKELADLFAVNGLLATDQKLDWDLLRTFLGRKKYLVSTTRLALRLFMGLFPHRLGCGPMGGRLVTLVLLVGR
jgi:hypothetical protein